MKRSYAIILMIGLVIGFSGGTTRAQNTESPAITEPGATTPGEAPVPQYPQDPVELEAFLDGAMAAYMEAYHIAGAVVAVVKGGDLLFARGYGYADVENKKPVIPDQTLFRIGSTSKLFTWTAVMQLVEKGLIQLDVDVNTYLKAFKIPETFAEPITMTHLLTHTAGFEDRFTGLGVQKTGDLVPMAEFLARHMPARVRPPGLITAYSNYGTALAGYIVETVSGVPFEQYVEDHIFKPLDMMHSTFRQPLPASLSGNMSGGYKYTNGIYEAQPFELINGMAPAGSMSCTAADMAKFMVAQLNLGEYKEHRILEEETARKMHTRLFANAPAVAGNAYGFWEFRHNRLRIIEHGGDTVYFHTLLALVPEKNIGFFVSFNTQPEKNPRYALLKSFLDRYYPAADQALPQPLKPTKSDLARFTGSYGAARSSFTTFEKVTGLIPFLNVSITKEGRLLARDKQWIQVEPLAFREVGGEDFMIFKEGQNGRIDYLFLSNIPHSAFIKLEGTANPFLHYMILGICGLFFLSTWRWPVTALFKKLCHSGSEKGRVPIWPRLTAIIMSTLYILSVIGIVIVLSDGEGLLFGGMIPFLKVVLVIPLLAVLLTLVTLFYTVLAWVKKYWTPCQRFHYTLVAAAALVFIWFLHYWNLLGFKI